MTTLLLVGAGAVGARAARQLVDTPGVERLLLASRHRPDRLAEALGERAEAIEYAPGDPIPASVRAVASALPSAPDAALGRRCADEGVPMASAADERSATDALLDLDDAATGSGAILAVGCGLAPGLADVLARHAADALDRADEVHVARTGAAGPASAAAVRWIRRDPAVEWHDGGWHEDRRGREQLIWFPEPIGARECATVAAGGRLLVEALPELDRATVRFDAPPARTMAARLPGRDVQPGWGAARVEAWGWRGRTREVIVYGVIDRTAIAAGTVLAVTAARLARLLPALTLRKDEPGARGLAALVDPPPFLAELARRGVKAAAFEGAAVA